jgi:hypothetical protein
MKRIASALVLAVAASLTSCVSGPHQLARTVDDLDQKSYINSPWINAVLHIVPAFPLAKFGAAVGDFFVTDAYSFWFKDAWDNKGTGFEHFKQTYTDGKMHSMLSSDGGFLKIMK